jgi:hypothetical protein
MILSRDAILAAQDLKREEVAVPEWGGSVLVRTMTGAERDAWEQSLVANGGKIDVSNVRARLVAACTIDESGALLFSAADAQALGAKSGSALERVAKVAQRLNAITEEALEEARGNSSAAPSGASTSS